MKNLFTLLVVLSIAVFSSCGGGKKDEVKADPIKAVQAPAKVDSAKTVEAPKKADSTKTKETKKKTVDTKPAETQTVKTTKPTKKGKK